MNKNEKIKNLSMNTVMFTISSFGTKFLSFFLVPLYTYVLLTDEYGMIDLMTTTVQLLIPILTLNIQDAILRYSLDADYEPADVISVGLKMVTVSSLLLGGLLVVFKYFEVIKLENNYLFFLYFSFVTGAANNSLTMYLKAKEQVKCIAFWGVINTIVTCIMNLFLLLGLGWGVNGYIISNIFGVLLADIGMFICGKVYLDINFNKNNKELLYTLLQYSLPLVANSISWWINNASDRYILTFFCGAAVNGIYAVSYKIPSILSAVQSVFYNAWSISAITEFDEEDKDGFIGSVYSGYSAVSIIICSIVMFFNIFIAKILYSKEFFQAWQYVPYLLVGTVFNGLGLFNGCIFTAVKKTKEISKTTILGAIINTLLNIVLIPKIGANGAAFATMVGYISIWVARTVYMRNIIKIKISWNKQVSCILLLLSQAVVASKLRNYLYQIPFLCVIILLQHDLIKNAGKRVLRLKNRK